MIEFSEVGTLFFTLLRTFLEERIGIFLPPPPPLVQSFIYLILDMGGGEKISSSAIPENVRKKARAHL